MLTIIYSLNLTIDFHKTHETPIRLIKSEKVLTSTSRKMEEMDFSLFLSLSTIKSPGHYIENKHKKTLKGGEKADLPGPSVPGTAQW